jgi:anthranilate synthase component 1
MYYPTEQEFIKLAKKNNLIPVCRETPADTETPVSAFLKIRNKHSFLLESVEGGEKIARYSFLGSNPYLIFRSRGKRIEIFKNGKKKIVFGDPFAHLRKLLSQFNAARVSGIPRFHGGAVGYIGYDMVRFIERIPDRNPDELCIPDMELIFTDTLLAFDHVKHNILIISNVHLTSNPRRDYRQAKAQIEALVQKLKKPLREKPKNQKTKKQKNLSFKSNFTKPEYEAVVEKAKEHIRAGDIFQVVPSQRFVAPFLGDAFNVYRSLRTINPSPYMYFLEFGELKVVGSSPEVMVRLEEGVATVRPIAGTRPRGRTPKEDKKLEHDLLQSKKECAEHLMLLDLGRNDLGRVCRFGTVTVTEKMMIERYSHVMHIVSNVEGKIKRGRDAFDVLKACFPAGTVSGAPKIRAMEIIDQLENTRRGLYAGAVGYFDFSGNLDTAIAIRTILIKDQKAYIQAGGGVVADSDPKGEYFETINKALGMLKALESAT